MVMIFEKLGKYLKSLVEYMVNVFKGLLWLPPHFKVKQDTKADGKKDFEHSVNNNDDAMYSTYNNDGSKNSLEKRIAMLERELEIKNREITSLQETCKQSGAPSEEVQEASDNLAATRTTRWITFL